MRDRAEGFDEFVQGRSAALLRSAFLLVGDAGLAEDLLQEVLAQMYVRWRRIRGHPEPYARRALTNRAINHWRWRRRRPELLTGEHVEIPTTDPADRVAGDDALVAALRLLPRRQRAAVVLRYVEDRPEQEVAQLLGCSVGAVKSNASRGLARLREALPNPSARTAVTAEGA